MEALYGQDGSVIGWLHPQNFVIDGARRCRAFVQDGGVYGFAGDYLGQFHNGFLCDRNGAVVGFVRDASGGPAKPRTRLPPLAPVVRVPLTRLVSRVAPARPAAHDTWFAQSFDTFLEGCQRAAGAAA